MTDFIGNEGNNLANAATGDLFFFTGGNVGQLTDSVGDSFACGDGDDFVFAANADDEIEGGEGHDLLNGGEGNDEIYGNTKSDPLGSGIGDQIVGNYGDDNLWGSNGDDVIDGGSGNDRLEGGGGADVLRGGNDDDFSHGDYLVGGQGADTLDGVHGDDSYYFFGDATNPGEANGDTINDTGLYSGEFDVIFVLGTTNFVNAAQIRGIEAVDFGQGVTATFTAAQLQFLEPNLHLSSRFASGGTFCIEMRTETVLDIASFEFQRWSLDNRVDVIGDADNEFISGTSQIDRLFGNGGNDTLIGNGGADEMRGGLGNDVYLVDQPSGEAIEAAGQGTDSALAFVSHTLAANVENLTLLGTFHINGNGNTLANTIIGGGGNNVLNGAAGIDSLQGLGGNDSYFVDSAADRIFETTGTDNVNASVSYTLAAGVAVETLRTTNAAGTAAINLTGNNLANIVIGNAGANNLNGGGGPDTMQGLAGNDIYVVDNVSDKAIEAVSAGIDRVNSTVSFTLGANVENLTLTGVAAISGAGNTLANIIIGNSANNGLSGGAGIDSLRGGLGNDSYIVDHVSDQVVETAGAGTDRIVSSVTEVLALNVENLTLTGTAAINGSGNTLNNLIIGNAANNILAGSSGIDSLSGSTGNDVLIGGGHRDIMTGGAGLDDFDFNVVAEMGKTAATRDVITDFTVGDDIDLSTIDANGALAGHTFSLLATKGAAFTGAAGQLRWFQASGATFVEGTVNADKVADFQIQLTGLKTLTAADFIL